MIQVLPEWALWNDAQIAEQLGVTRQAVFYARRRAAGLCVRCGSPAEPGRPHCAKHSKAITASLRKSRGFKKWKPGGVGRPPTGLQKIL